MRTLSLGMNRSSRSKRTATPAGYSENGRMKDGFPTCSCGRETSDCSTHPSGTYEWIASMRDGLARIFQSPVLARALKESAAASGRKCGELLARYDRESCSWKTPQLSLLGGSTPFSGTLPAWGTMRGGVFYRRRPSVPRTFVLDGGVLRDVPTPKAAAGGPDYARMSRKESGGHDLATWTALWPTPNATDGRRGANRPDGRRGLKLTDCNLEEGPMWPTPCSADAGKGGRGDLYAALNDCGRQKGRVFPTPKARDWKNGDKPGDRRARAKRSGQWHSPDLNDVAAPGGQLNPMWVEWLMGWPLGWTGLSVSATGRSHSKRRQRTSS